MRACSSSSPIVLQHRGNSLAEGHPFFGRQIGLLVLRERSEQEDRHCLTAEQINDASAATLAAYAKPEPHLPDPATPRNDDSAKRIGSNRIDNGGALVGREEPLGISQIRRRFDDRLHLCRYYGIAVDKASLPPRRERHRKPIDHRLRLVD